MLRREFFKTAGGLFLLARHPLIQRAVALPLPGGTLDPLAIEKFAAPLLIPPVMPRDQELNLGAGLKADYYEIAVRQFAQQVLPAPLPKTTVWGYGARNYPETFSFPSFTLEARYGKPVRVKWINGLLDAAGNYLPHLLPVDPTLHWANPGGPRDAHGSGSTRYTGPVPMVPHLHGGHSDEASDGYPEAWYLPKANNIPGSFFKTGTWYEQFRTKAQLRLGVNWEEGSAVFQYDNDQRASTLWFHDHTLGITRLNVYAGPAGFYLLRGGPDDFTGDGLPGPAPQAGDGPNAAYREIPIVIQDRTFNTDGSLFYPDCRAFFEGLDPSQLNIPFKGQSACNSAVSDVSPIWNPEFFGNTMVVNGRAWPYLEVDRRRYRFRFLNGCNARFLVLRFDRPLSFVQIGSDGGFLPRPVILDRLLLSPAARADVIVDFGQVPPGTRVRLLNIGPDEPFGGGEPDRDFDTADPQTTGMVMEFRVSRNNPFDPSLAIGQIAAGLPRFTPLGTPTRTRRLSLNENVSKTVFITNTESGGIEMACGSGEAFGPTSADLGTLGANQFAEPATWMDNVTETPVVGTTEDWEIYNFTADAHPIHLHLVQFQVIDRQALAADEEGMALQPATRVGRPVGPAPNEAGFLDTVTAYPGQVTRIRARFDKTGHYVWHCHILEHEDNDMMRPLQVIEG